MALIKQYVTPKGSAEYWVVGLVQIDNFNKTAYVRMYGFANKIHANMENPIPIMTLEVNIDPEVYDYYFSREIMILPDVTPQTQSYQIFKDFNIDDGKGGIYNFSDAEDEINGVVEP